LSFYPPVGADRGGGEIGHPEVGGVVVQGRAIVAEQPAELGERLEVAAVGEGGNTEEPPGPGGDQAAFGWIDGGERPVGVPAGRGGVAAHGQDGGGDHVGGRGDDAHVVRLGQAGSLGGGLQCVVPPPRVDVGPPEPGQGCAAGASHAGSPEPLHGVLQQADRQVGFVQEKRGRTCSPQRRPFKRRAGDSAQVGNQLLSAADWVDAGAYLQFQRAEVNELARAGGRRVLAFQQVEGAADGPAAGGRAGLVGDGGRVREDVPGEGRLATRCLFDDGDER
jgi:hypothetical protein